MTAEQRAELKTRIMGVMRRRASGVSADLVAAELQVDLMVAERMLREMVDEGMLGTSAGRASPSRCATASEALSEMRSQLCALCLLPGLWGCLPAEILTL